MKVRGNGSIRPLDKDAPRNRCRHWELAVPCGKDEETGKYIRRYRRVHDVSETTAKRLLSDFIAEIEGEDEAEQARASLAEEAEYQRLRDEMDRLKRELNLERMRADDAERLLARNNPEETPLIDDYAWDWAEFRKATNGVAASTSRNDEKAVRTILRHLGGKRLGEIQRKDVRAFYRAMMAPGGGLSGIALSGSSAQDVAVVLTQIFSQAVGDEDIPLEKSPTQGIPLPRIDREEKEALSEADTRKLIRLLSAGKPNAHAMGVFLALGCGLRRGEVCALRWCDFDEENRVLHIRHTYSQARNNDGTIVGLKPPKTKSGIRAMPLGAGVYERLIAWKRAQGVYLLSLGLDQSGERPIVSNQFGGYMKPTLLARWWDRFSAENGIDASLHQLRHTYLTMLCAGGVDIITASRLAGHKDTSMISRVYAHAVPRNLKAASELISSELFDNAEPRIIEADFGEGDDGQSSAQRPA